jgi:RNase P subunit RPR2
MATEKGIPRSYCKDCKAHLTKFYTVRSAIRRALRTYTNMSEFDIIKVLEKEKEKFYERRRGIPIEK